MKKICLVLCFTIASVASAQPAAPTLPPQPVEAPKSPPASKPEAAPTPALAPLGSTSNKVTSIPTYERPEPVSYNARLGVGSSFGPQALWFDASVETQFDKFVALGPKVQYGTNSTTDFLLGSFGPRFTIPFSYFEFGVNAGFGFAYRNVAGFEFTNFLYEAGANLDLYLFQNMSLGVGYNANFLSASAETFFSALVLSVTGHF